MSSDSFYHLQPWGKSSFWFIFLNCIIASWCCSLLWQHSATSGNARYLALKSVTSDWIHICTAFQWLLPFSDYQCVPVAPGLPHSPCFRVATQREPWESPTDFSAAWPWAIHLHIAGHSTLPAPHPGQSTPSWAVHTKAEWRTGCQPLPLARCSWPWS